MYEEKIDYLTITCDSCTTDRLVEEFDQIPRKENLLRYSEDDQEDEHKLEELGKFKRISAHYRNHFHWFFGSGIASELSAGEQGNHKMMVNIGGKGMEVLRSFGYDDLEIFKVFEKIGFGSTRIDFSLDFHEEDTWKEIAKAIREHLYITRTKAMNLIVDPITREIETIYIGSQKNREVLLCMYDKRKEQNKKIVMRNRKEKRHDRLITTPWYRVEIRLYNGSKDKVCSEMFSRVLKGSFDKDGNQTEQPAKDDREMYKLFRGKINSFFRFIETDQMKGHYFYAKENAWGNWENNKFKRLKNPKRIKTAKFWEALLGETTTRLKRRKLEYDYSTYVDTMNIQVSKRIIKRFMATWGIEERELVKAIKDIDKKKEVIAAMLSRDEELIKDLLDYGIENWKQEDQNFVDQVLIRTMKEEDNPYPFLEEKNA